MNLVNAPLSHPDSAGSPRGVLTVRAMELGQHVIAVALTVIGVVRAVGAGAPIATAVISGIAVLAWHTAGALIPAHMASRWFATGWLIGFAAVWIAAVAVSAEFVWLAFLLWLLAGHLLPTLWGLLFSAFVLSVVVVAPVLHHGTTSYANVFGPLIGGIFAYGISRGYLQLLSDAAERELLVSSLTRAQRETSALQDELALAQRESGAMAERTRIARDIHDTVAQDLSSIRLLAHAGATRASASRSPDAAAEATADAADTLTQIAAVAGESLVDVRRIIEALVPAELENNPLAAALQRMLDRLRDETGIDVALHVDASFRQLPSEVEVALLRTAQSALANVRQHAHAHRIVVSLLEDARSVRLDLSDDGVGFDASEWERRGDSNQPSYGLRFMRDRLRELGGDLDIEAVPGEGTAVSVVLPIHPHAQHEAPSVISPRAGSTTSPKKSSPSPTENQ